MPGSTGEPGTLPRTPNHLGQRGCRDGERWHWGSPSSKRVKTLTFKHIGKVRRGWEEASTGSKVRPELLDENEVLSGRFCSLQGRWEESGIWGLEDLS